MSVDSIVRTDLVDVPICILSIGIQLYIYVYILYKERVKSVRYQHNIMSSHTTIY